MRSPHSGSPMTALALPPGYPRIQRVQSFRELVTTPFVDGVNALYWERSLPGNFGEIVAAVGGDEAIVTLEEERLRALPVSAAGRVAIDVLLEDLRLLREHELDPMLNCIHGYPRDDSGDGIVRTDVFSFHADSATVAADTYLCTYHGAASEGVRNDAVERKVDIPAIRAELLRSFGGEDNEDFSAYLHEHCYDLHYAPKLGARPFSFGLGHFWRIAIEYPGNPVPPCIHRAPESIPGQPRLLLIS